MGQSLIPNPDPTIVLPPPHGSVGDYFTLKALPPDSNTFEIGLVLGGTVSAAAYTAGVLDFLVQALDAWTVAKNTGDPNAPQHNVVIKIACGTSGGGVSAVLLARALGYAFPHCDATLSPKLREANPLYDIWVNQIDIRDLLQLSDLKADRPVSSLMCADKIESVANEKGSYVGKPLGTLGTPTKRNYVEQLLPIVLTLTNLRGVPYSSDFRGTSGRPEYYTDRADHIRFRVDITGNHPPAPGNLKPYEVGISDTPANGVQPWSTIIRAALGTSAFPVGLPSQTISRDAQHYRYRYAVIHGAAGAEAVWLRPAWPYMIPVGSTNTNPYQFLAVDGGCIDNAPIEFARQWLAGVLGQNDRTALGAHRAVVLVDPFANTPTLGLIDDPGLFGVAGATLSSLVAGGRFSTADRDLFTAEDVYSRFLVNPVRRNADNTVWTGGDAIATSCLAAFGGFLYPAFREHDFFLGRQNCRAFLRNHFVLHQDNSLFASWTAEQKARYRGVFPDLLPIIPLVGALSDRIETPPWPKGMFDPSSIRDLLTARIDKLTKLVAQPIAGDQPWPLSWLLNLAISKAGGKGAEKAIELITRELRSARLLD